MGRDRIGLEEFARRVEFLFLGIMSNFSIYVFLRVFSRRIEVSEIFYAFSKIPLVEGGGPRRRTEDEGL